jgi:transcriptional regulator with XRE-family HTH domain
VRGNKMGKQLGEFLRNKRKERKESVRSLSERAGLSKSYLDFIESGVREPSSDILYKIADSLSIPIEVLLDIKTNEDLHRLSEYSEIESSKALINYDTFDSDKYIDEIISLDNIPKVMLMAKYGTGKSSLIKKITPFSEELNFPFVNTSRTTIFPCEYVFKNGSGPYQFATTFISEKDVIFRIEYAIDKAIETYIDSFEINPETLQDTVISSFISTNDNFFDFKFLCGNYYKINSPKRNDATKREEVTFWNEVFSKIADIFEYITSQTHEKNKDSLLKQFNEYLILSEDSEETAYNSLKEYVFSMIINNFQRIIESLNNNPAISIYNCNIQKQNEWLRGFSCEIIDFYSTDFKDFIMSFTSKDASYYKKSIFSLINKMRIELPFNDNISDKSPIVFLDTVGAGHQTGEISSLENSIELPIEDMDVILVLDNSMVNMDSDTEAILKHVVDRASADKIFIAYNRFEDFTRTEFEDNSDDEKMDYLKEEQNKKLRSILKEKKEDLDYYIPIIDGNTFFLSYIKNLVDSKTFSSVNILLNCIHKYYKKKNDFLIIDKVTKNKRLFEYDYNKLSVIFFNKIYSRYFNAQNEIYLYNPPHYKTTEALIWRLYIGQPYFSGARHLCPADDLYTVIIEDFKDYIYSPISVNFVDTKIIHNHKYKLLEKFNEIFCGILAKRVKSEFISNDFKPRWSKLYRIKGVYPDHNRRIGLLDTFKKLIPNVDQYLNNTGRRNWVNILKEVFDEALIEMDKIIDEKAPLG